MCYRHKLGQISYRFVLCCNSHLFSVELPADEIHADTEEGEHAQQRIKQPQIHVAVQEAADGDDVAENFKVNLELLAEGEIDEAFFVFSGHFRLFVF